MQPNADDSATPLSITLTMSISATADWRTLIAESSSAVSQFFIKDPADAFAGGTTALLNFFTSFKLNRSPGYLVWALTLNATAWSINNSIDANSDIVKKIVNATKNFLNVHKSEYQKNGIVVPLDFFERPTRLPLYQDFRDHLLGALEINESEQSLARKKIDSGFAIAIFELMARRNDFYSPISGALDVQGREAASLARSWQNYRAHLVYDFDVKEIFGQEGKKISLSQLYVPLRGAWQEPTDRQVKTDFSSRDNQHVLQIDTALDDWLDRADPEDWVRLLGGGPGSGKSTTLKALAHRVAQSGDYRPLFIPLQHLDLGADLRVCINQHFINASDSPFNEALT